MPACKGLLPSDGLTDMSKKRESAECECRQYCGSAKHEAVRVLQKNWTAAAGRACTLHTPMTL